METNLSAAWSAEPTMTAAYTAAQTIRTAMDRLRRQQISPAAFRDTMAELRGQMGDAEYTKAKFLAAANDR